MYVRSTFFESWQDLYHLRRIEGHFREGVVQYLCRIRSSYCIVVLANQLWNGLFWTPWQPEEQLQFVREQTVEEDDALQNEGKKSVRYQNSFLPSAYLVGS